MFFLYETYNFFYYLIKFKLFVLCIPLLFSLFFAGYGILSKNPFETLPCLSASAFCLFLFDILRRSFMK
ncbi:hypothetical protein ABW50_21525 [Escherichia coli]|nr:hypothetical protein ABW50_21525 [Escherichia coli]